MFSHCQYLASNQATYHPLGLPRKPVGIPFRSINITRHFFRSHRRSGMGQLTPLLCIYALYGALDRRWSTPHSHHDWGDHYFEITRRPGFLLPDQLQDLVLVVQICPEWISHINPPWVGHNRGDRWGHWHGHLMWEHLMWGHLMRGYRGCGDTWCGNTVIHSSLPLSLTKPTSPDLKLAISWPNFGAPPSSLASLSLSLSLFLPLSLSSSNSPHQWTEETRRSVIFIVIWSINTASSKVLFVILIE